MVVKVASSQMSDHIVQVSPGGLKECISTHVCAQNAKRRGNGDEVAV